MEPRRNPHEAGSAQRCLTPIITARHPVRKAGLTGRLLSGPASVGEIALRAGVARSLASHHLRMLRASRLLRATRSGKQVIYTAADDRVRCIVADLAAHVLETPEDPDEV